MDDLGNPCHACSPIPQKAAEPEKPSDEDTTKAILLDGLRSIGETNLAEDCRLVDAADYLRDKVKERIHYLNLAHQQGAENTVYARKELARVRADLQRAEKDRDNNHKAWCEAKEELTNLRGLYEGMREDHANFESIRNGDLVEVLEELVKRCDGQEGVRADGSNIDTLRAHAALGHFRFHQDIDQMESNHPQDLPSLKVPQPL